MDFDIFKTGLAFYAKQQSNPILIIDSKCRIICTNNFFLNLIQAKPDDNLKLEDLVIQSSFMLIKNVIETDSYNEFTPIEITFVNSNNYFINSKFIFSRIYGEDSKLNALILKIANPEYGLISNEELEAKNRIADLNIKRLHKANLRLSEAREIEQRAIKIKENFLANVSHEIRTPLNGIIGVTELLKDTKLDQKQLSFLNAITKSSAQLLTIINDLLDLSKIKSLNFKLDNQHFCLKDSLESILPIYQIMAEERSIDFNFRFDDNIKTCIHGDQYRLNQVLNNLLNNAFKFTPNGSISVEAELKSESSNICVIEFRVSDTGIGISEENLNDIFEDFSQISTLTSKKYGGTGLGLSISKQLIERMGGKINATSKEGKGTTFKFELPFTKSNQKGNNKNRKPFRNIGSLGQMKILIVDDNEINRFYLENSLNYENIEIVTAENGKIACEFLKSEKFDLVLMDLQMPVMNGYAATEFIRKELNLKVPIIAITASSVLQEEARCTSVGINSIIQKPFSKEVLLLQIINLLSAEKVLYADVVAKTSTFSLQKIVSIVGEDAEKINEFLDLGINNVSAESVNLKNALVKSDFVKVKQIAHKIKSTVGLFDMITLHQQLSKLEDLCVSNASLNELNELGQEILSQLEGLKQTCINNKK